MRKGDGCYARSPRSGLRCTRERRHAGEHERRRRSGDLLELWDRVDGDDQSGPGATLGELLGHLEDLIALSKSEGYGRFVGILERAYREAKHIRRRPRPTRPGTRPLFF
jgi:hypothetical protein